MHGHISIARSSLFHDKKEEKGKPWGLPFNPGLHRRARRPFNFQSAGGGVYVAGGRSARKMIQWIIFSKGRAAAQGRRLKAASSINFCP